MIRLLQLLIFGYSHSHVWETVRTVDMYSRPDSEMPYGSYYICKCKDCGPTSKANAAHIANMFPATTLSLVEALKEWRDAYGAWASAESAARLGLAADTLFALIGDDT